MFILGSKDGALRAAFWCLVREKGRISAIGELAILDGKLLWSSDMRTTAKSVSLECTDSLARLQGERVICSLLRFEGCACARGEPLPAADNTASSSTHR